MAINAAFYPNLMWNSRFASLANDPFNNPGLSNPILNQDGYLDHFANPVTVVAANFGDQSPWINALILIRASDEGESEHPSEFESLRSLQSF